MALEAPPGGSCLRRANARRVIFLQNIQVTYDNSTSNARSESSVAINPNNPDQIVAASKKFANIETYDFTLAAEFSTDGGRSWLPSPALALPEGATVMTDPTLAWDDSNNVFLVGLTGYNPPTWDTIGIVIYMSSDGGLTWSDPNPIHYSSADDKQWAAGDTSPSSPFQGNVYAVWDNGSIAFARTTDHGMSWEGTSGQAAGVAIAPGDTVYPEITVSDNGTVYVVSTDTTSLVAMMVSTDGGDSFQPAVNPATGITTLEDGLTPVDGWAELPGGTFRVISDPTVAAYGDILLVAWSDYREDAARIYYVRSVDGGKTWSSTSGQRLDTATVPSDFHHVMPQMVVDHLGVFGCVYYEFGPKPTKMLIDVVLSLSFDQGQTFGRSVLTTQPWDPTVDAPWAHGDPHVTFIGDYMGLDASSQGFQPVWTDTRTGIQELFTTTVPADLWLCIVEVLDELSSGEIQLARRFRDEEMAATDTGRRLTGLIQQHSAEIAGYLATDSGLRAQAVSLLRRSIDIVRSADSAEPGRFDRGFISDADELLDRLHAIGGSDLQRDIEEMRPELHAAEGKTVIEALG
jgi:hypothetical protein